MGKQIGFDKLESIPNVGSAIAEKLRALGFNLPIELKDQNPYKMYHDLCERTGKQQDPCLLDVFISAVSFVDGNPLKPWWYFTSQRKETLRTIK